MNFSEKVAEIEGKVKSYRLEIEGVEEIPAEEMVRVMLEEGKMLDYKKALENAPHKTGNFVEVPVMLNE